MFLIQFKIQCYSQQFVEDLINPTAAPDQKSINDIPAMLAAASVDRKTFNVGPPSDSKWYVICLI